MAGKIVIDTKINVDEAKADLKSLEKEYEDLKKKHKEASDRLENQLNMGFTVHDSDTKEIDAMIDRMGYLEDKIKSTKNAIAESKASKGTSSATKEIEEQGEAAEKASEKVKKLKNACKKTSNSVKTLGKSAKSSGSNINFGVKKMMKMYAVLRALRGLLNMIKNALKDGINNLAQFNNGLNPTNKALSSIKSAFTQFKNSIAVAISPIITMLEPALVRLINLLSRAMNALGQFFSAMSGARVFNKAIAVQEDYAKSLNNTASSAKKAKGELYAFDSLNVVKKDDSSAGGSISPNQMFEETKIDSELLTTAEKSREIFLGIKETIQGIFSKIDISPFKRAFESIKESTKNFLPNIDFSTIISSFEKFAERTNPLIEKLSNAFVFLYDKFLLPLSSFAINDLIPTYLDAISSALDGVNTVLDILSPALNALWDNVIVPIGKMLGGFILDRINIVKDAINSFTEMISDPERKRAVTLIFTALANAISQLLPIVKTVLSFINSLFKAHINRIINTITHVIDILSGVIKFIEGVFTGDFNKALEGIKDIFFGFINIFIDTFQWFLDVVIGALNSFSVDVPDYVPIIGGKTVGFNIPEIKLPRLATGTVVPRQSREFAAILGDNNRETEVVSPLSTIEQALRNVIGEGGRETNVYISADGDLDAIVRLLNLKIEKENKRVGRNFEKVVKA